MTIDHTKKIITVVAAVILNQKNQILLVRKKGTHFFMQVGGKIEKDENIQNALIREIKEEIQVDATIEEYLGFFETQAANEQNYALHAHVFMVSIQGLPQIGAEIEDMIWQSLDHDRSDIAPLTQNIIVPLLQTRIKH